MKQCQCEQCLKKRKQREKRQLEMQKQREKKMQEEKKRYEEMKKQREQRYQKKINGYEEKKCEKTQEGNKCKHCVKETTPETVEPQVIEKVYHHKVTHILPVNYIEIEKHITHHEYVYEETYVTEREDIDCGKIEGNLETLIDNEVEKDKITEIENK